MDRECKCCGAQQTPSKRKLSNEKIQHGLFCNIGCGEFVNVRSARFGANQKFIWYSDDVAKDLKQKHWEKNDGLRQVEMDKKKAEENAEWWRLYYEFIRPDNPVWQEQRRLVFERDGGRCRMCLDATATIGHHVIYPTDTRYLDRVPLCYIIAVCKPCHDQWHNLKDEGIFKPHSNQCQWLRLKNEGILR